MATQQPATDRDGTPAALSTESRAINPALIPLQPLADSLIEPITTLLNELYSTFPKAATSPIVTNDVLKTALDNLLAKSALTTDIARPYQKIVSEVVILHVLSSLIEQSYKSSEPDYLQLNSKIFILLDISIHSTAITQTSDIDLPFLLIHNVIVKTDKKYVLQYFQDAFFSQASKKRVEYLRKHCGVTTATKRPGTEILETYNDITKIYDLKNEVHAQFIGKWRLFISETFPISETSLSNPGYKVNDHNGVDKEVHNSVKRGRSTPFTLFARLRYQLTYPETIFSDKRISRDFTNATYDLVKAIFDEDIKGNDYKSRGKGAFDISNKVENTLEIDLLSSLAENFQFSSLFDQSEELFGASFKNKVFRQCLILQIYMILNHILSYGESPAFSKTLIIRSGIRETKDFAADVKKLIQAHYKKFDEQFFFTITSVAMDSNKFWVEWKSSGFKITRETKIDEKLITKAKEVVKKNSRVRPKHIPKYGTNEISRIWELKTGLKNLNQKSTIDSGKFEELREELSKAQNTLKYIEEDPEMFTPSEIADAKTKKELLTYKALRLHREHGNWLSFANTNFKLGVEGLFNPSLMEKFKEEEAIAEKERQEKEKEIKDEEGDVEMKEETRTETPVDQANGKKETETAHEEDDLDY